MNITKVDFQGDPNIGLYGLVSDKYIVISNNHECMKDFNAPVILNYSTQTKFNGIFLAGNSNGIIAPAILTGDEKKTLKTAEKISKGIQLAIIETRHTALGNLIVCNDKGAIVSPLLEKHIKSIEEALGVKAKIGTIMDMNIVGSLCVATNKGFLLSMNASEDDFKLVKRVLKVNGDIGSINFGGPFVKSGLLANSNGILVGSQTTGPELARIEEAFGLI